MSYLRGGYRGGEDRAESETVKREERGVVRGFALCLHLINRVFKKIH